MGQQPAYADAPLTADQRAQFTDAPLTPPAAAPTLNTPIAKQAEQMLMRSDLPDSVRSELDAIRTGTAKNGPTNVGAMVDAWGKAGPHRVVEGIKDVARGNVSRGANGIIVGAGITAAPMVAPEVLPAIVAASGAAAATVGGSALVQQVVPPMARALGASADQADLAGTVGSAGAGTAIAKYGVPALATWSANRKAAAMGDAYLQATHDIQAALGVNADDVHRARPFLEAVHNEPNGIPIAGNDAAQQFVKAADVAVDEIEKHIAGLVQQFPNASVPSMEAAIIRRVAAMPGSSVKDIEAARAVIREYGLDQPRSLTEAESLRVRLNAENRSTLEGSGVKQRTASATNGAFVARQEAANQLRDGIYGTLEQNGVHGIRDLRASEGSILKLRNAADPVTRGIRGESTVARTGQVTLGQRVLRHVVRGGSAAVGAYAGGPIGAAAGAEVGQDLASGLVAKNMSKNELLERAFRQSFTSPPVMSVQAIPATNFTSARGRVPIIGAPPMPLLSSHQRALPSGE